MAEIADRTVAASMPKAIQKSFLSLLMLTVIVLSLLLLLLSLLAMLGL